jgi:hypothetical protein
MNMVEAIKEQLSGQVMSKLSSLVGENEAKTKTAVGAAIPAVLSGLSSVASSGSGAQKLASALGNFDTGSLSNIAGMLSGNSGAMLEQGTAILGSLFGGSTLSGIINALSRFSGMGAGASKNLLGYLMPLMLGTIAGKMGPKGLNPQALASMFAEQKANISSALPSGFSLNDIPGLASVGAAARQAVGSAQDAGASAARWLWPVAGVVLVGLIAWYFLGRREAAVAPVADSVAKAGNAAKKTVTALKVPIEDAAGALPAATQLGKDLTAVYTSASETLSGIKDAASAEKALPELKELTDKVGALKSAWDKLPEAGQATISSITSSHLGKLKDLVTKVEAMPGVGDKVKPILDQLVAKLSALASK